MSEPFCYKGFVIFIPRKIIPKPDDDEGAVE